MKKIKFFSKLTGSRKRIAIGSFLTLAAVLIAVTFLTGNQRNFQRFSDDFFVSEVTANTLNMHYTVADPSAYGVEKYDPVLPAYSKDGRDASYQELSKSVQKLEKLNNNMMSKKDSYTYDLLLSYLLSEQEGQNFIYYSNPLSPSSGMQSQLPILLAEYTFRDKQDVEDYLSILDQTDTYFSGLADYLEEQAGQGLFMPDYSVDKVIEQCGAIMDVNLLSSGTHFLHTTFQERLDALEAGQMITAEEKTSYLSENDRLLTTVMLPAYEKLGDRLLLLKGNGKNEQGLFYYPQGREYYLYLLKATTGSYHSIDEIKQMIFDDFNKNYDAMIQLVKDNKQLLTMEAEPAFAFDNPADMLKNLQKMMGEDFPPLSGVTNGPLPVCTVKSISENLQDYCSPAFYLTPPFDDIHNNVIYINQKNNPEGVDLYTTLAHEGYPGHLYQTVYSQLYQQKEELHPVRALLNYGGYVEGWAMYVELISYDYAKNTIAGQNAESLYESYRLNRQIQLALYSLLDIAIHYEGATYEQVHKILASIGIQDASVTRNIYEYIAEEPATYPKYYLGYLEILNLKEQALELWGADYSDYRFHSFYLENGPSDFYNLTNQLKKTSGKSDS